MSMTLEGLEHLDQVWLQFEITFLRFDRVLHLQPLISTNLKERTLKL